MNLFKPNVFLILFLLSITACATDSEYKQPNIYDTWTLEKIIYDDESIKILEEGNFVTIKDNYILEIIKNHGKRRYSYVKRNNTLNLTSGGEVVKWKIIQNSSQELHIKTPIGLYLLTR